MELLAFPRLLPQSQGLALQKDARQTGRCEKIFSNVVNGVLADFRAGNVLVVWSLDRLGSRCLAMIAVVGELQGRGLGFRSLRKNVDTATAGGKLVLHPKGALAEFELHRRPSR